MSSPTRLLAWLFTLTLLLVACGEGDSIVEPGPDDSETTTTTTTTEAPDPDDGDDDPDEGDGDDSGEVETDDEAPETTTSIASDATEDGESSSGAESPATTFVVNENSENAAVYTELAVSGLVLSLDEQTCADTTASDAIDAGTNGVDAVIGAVQDCASPAAIDDFASNLILAGGAPLPSTEAACISSKLQSADEYRPFWVALLEEEPFDFLLASSEVQDRYLDLYADCVSVGRAVAEQANIELSVPTQGCIDDLYNDREFVRLTIEADLSGNEDDLSRINSQLAGCLTTDERNALAEN